MIERDAPTEAVAATLATERVVLELNLIERGAPILIKLPSLEEMGERGESPVEITLAPGTSPAVSYDEIALADKIGSLLEKEETLGGFAKFHHHLSAYYRYAELQEKSVERAKKATELSDDAVYPWELAKVLFESGRIEPALGILQELSRVGSSPEPFLLLGYLALKAGDIKGAEALIDSALSLDRNSFRGSMLKGAMRMRAAQWGEAIMWFRKGSRIEQRSAVPHAYTGVCSWVLGNKEKAVQELIQATELDPLEKRGLSGSRNDFQA